MGSWLEVPISALVGATPPPRHPDREHASRHQRACGAGTSQGTAHLELQVGKLEVVPGELVNWKALGDPIKRSVDDHLAELLVGLCKLKGLWAEHNIVHLRYDHGPTAPLNAP